MDETEVVPHNRAEARVQIDLVWAELQETYARYQRDVRTLDPDIQDDLRKYLCIRMCGFLEQAVFMAISGYMREGMSGSAKNFYSSWFKKAPNLTPNQFAGLVGRFGDPWKSEFKAFLDFGLRRDELENLLKLRNDVAHGRAYRGNVRAIDSYMHLVKEIQSWAIDHWVDTEPGMSLETATDAMA